MLALMLLPGTGLASPRLEALQTLDLPSIPGGMRTYYSPHTLERAQYLQQLLGGEIDYFATIFNTRLAPVILAVLDPAQWPQVAGADPYGMPSVDGPDPYVFVMPADWSAVTWMPIPQRERVPPAVLARAMAGGKTWEQIKFEGCDGIGAHEIGHTIAYQLGVDAQTHWLNEFLASYVGYAYLKAKHPDQVLSNEIFWAQGLDAPHPITQLADFERMYTELMQKHPANYGWFQVALDQRVIEVFNESGVEFLRSMQTAFPKNGPKLDSDQVLDKLETLSPGWKKWAGDVQAGDVHASMGSEPATIAVVMPADEAAAVKWLQDAAHVFTGASPSIEELQPLVAQLQGARVIGVGEATHGSHEDQSFKASLIKALVQQGRVNLLVLESNRQIGMDFDQYVNGRGGDLPILIRSPGFARVWRTEEFTDLILWLRAYNLQTDRPVHVVGVDCQDAGADALFALRFVGARDRATAARLSSAFIPIVAARRFSLWTTSASSADFLSAMTASIEPHGGRGDPKKDEMEYYGRRDRYMAVNLLEQTGGRGAAFWAHDLHVMADVPETDHWPKGYTWVGREVRRTLGSQYQTVTFAWSLGSFRAQTQTGDADSEVMHRKPLVPQTFPNDRPGDLGGVLLQTGMERFWTDLRTLPQEPWAQRFASTPYPRGWAGWRVDPQTWNMDDSDTASLRPATDILVWFKTITPSRLLPGDDF